ncbi:1-(5-phosphoribosyl)-5-[(5-phosphoribosylamino)methylideneamino]imidazole-4-carboxamide isomerase [Bacillus carboniphilus]|uniref:1-(5-phosphoribosyl)-5-[(5-phosphoribosylamino)methylideneamino] imidazole-4-carboxamide isomerase n=1 Tax=Bacillus carboniphilus TaxID=86663 RepID=A0ABY9JRS2_9BACI|nr:1-(5-phosphoribosyl)-5-[(5-phosphoribosylamino)methylideneamino]imidazole-4-carboxamide isomerase [Bacillus carboniphilus]WLR41438.1 1-(5-phosphoribosyl)-5-[(5-phosphoribosylamino)methylideneamino]imidazole-4-carboxamide isomerase [Bacillus carboniphilus]
MSFVMYPAIDIRGGKCVRLVQGDFNQETVFGESPLPVVKSFIDQGTSWIHMVDLDGARQGERVNASYVIEAVNLGVKVQVGGGIRTEDDIKYYLENGVERVILGSSVVSDPTFAYKMVDYYGEKIAVGIDARDGYVSTHGWKTTSTIKATQLGMELASAGVERFIFTDISTDGLLKGPNIEAINEMARVTGKEVIASGGVSSYQDLHKLRDIKGVQGAIVGKAIYLNRIKLKKALEKVKAQ